MATPGAGWGLGHWEQGWGSPHCELVALGGASPWGPVQSLELGDKR